MNYVTLDEVMNQLGIEKRKSSTLESMTKDEILNMTPEQAKKICEEVGEGWCGSNDHETIELFAKPNVSSDGTITINFEQN